MHAPKWAEARSTGESAGTASVLRILIGGSAAGGGFPQWNSNGPGCRRARAGDPAAKPRTQSSLAVSADGERWVLFNASPDLRAQIEANRQLHPREGIPSKIGRASGRERGFPYV